MAEKFLVVRQTKSYVSGGGGTLRDVMVVEHEETDSKTEARQAAHMHARANPSQIFTIIQIIGHAVADLVRDLEP